jgi:diguanylate cyclase (GGDEF)-like protein
MLSALKMGGVVYAALVLNNFYGRRQALFELNDYFSFMAATIIFIALPLSYTYWTFVLLKKISGRTLRIIEAGENLFFVGLFWAVVMLTGAGDSRAKAIFLFVIITSTIQLGMGFGIFTAALSSAALIIIDIFHQPAAGAVNVRFEDDIAMITLFFAVASSLGYYVRANAIHIKGLVERINVDWLTGLLNHRSFHTDLSFRFEQFTKGKAPLALALLDIDYFKQYNDMFGHPKGDEVLKGVGNTLREYQTGLVTPYRYGGDEFALIMAGMDNAQIGHFTSELRRVFSEMEFEGEEFLSAKKLTVSVGVAVADDYTDSAAELLKYADDALYKSKFNDRNRIEFYSSALEWLKDDIERQQGHLIPTIKTLAGIINAKDKYTYGHMEKVVLYAKLLARELDLDAVETRRLILGAYVHDIGKLNISEAILVKKTPLETHEWEALKQHPVHGEQIIRPIPALREAAGVVLHHHERFDGRGYPDGLLGHQIPYLARVMAVVDSFDAMTTERPYKRRLSFDEAIIELKSNAGTQFDPRAVSAFLRALKNHRRYLSHIESGDYAGEPLNGLEGEIADE